MRRHEGFSGINVTPLTDVMLVLLITFLLTASSFESSALSVPLPQVVEASEVDRHSVVLEVDRSGELQWPNSRFSELPVAEALEELRQESDEVVLAIAVHRECPYGKLFEVVEQAVVAGWQDVILLTEEKP